ncbi:MAG: hypothetical protein P8L79_15590 [Rhodospirillaceae bacterium]|nr:hypothetical protein [Rhodospirillaceae bacterium]
MHHVRNINVFRDICRKSITFETLGFHENLKSIDATSLSMMIA